MDLVKSVHLRDTSYGDCMSYGSLVCRHVLLRISVSDTFVVVLSRSATTTLTCMRELTQQGYSFETL